MVEVVGFWGCEVSGVFMLFYDVYGVLIVWVFSSLIEVNECIGMCVYVGWGGMVFCVDLSDGFLLIVGYCKIFLWFVVVEVVWYVWGE